MKRGLAPPVVVARGHAPALSAAPPAVVQPRRVSSRELLCGQLEIEHDAQICRHLPVATRIAWKADPTN
jgi:hypothetical protein